MDINELTKEELIELAIEKGVSAKGLSQCKKADIIEKINAAGKGNEGSGEENEGTLPKGAEPPTRAELIQLAIAQGYDEASLNSLSDDEIVALLEPKE
jgi:hypothetical protein